ncbi:bifunctional 5,10-methylenetetrahydrofolate dehydrogenase/5,10-methenyltetrahydrofolate cyclohydrolase [Candidatus Dojkabacteria bacterium]|nr:bifunctional 5,10-methylenetetrahydrofolate dehydrogenase/5,10-methenyltetrahydrofolate cyclohydrolase [Candidatus Dojkabacteria bacterium]
METKILDGKALSEAIFKELKVELSENNYKPHLDIIIIGNVKSSHLYVDLKKKKGEEIGVPVKVHRFPQIKTSQLFMLINNLNKDNKTTGYIIQMPIPKESLELDTLKDVRPVDFKKDSSVKKDNLYWMTIKEIFSKIDPGKDADGLSSATLGMVFHDSPKSLLSATPKAVLASLEEIFQTKNLKKALCGKNITIVNRSDIVGKPLAAALINLDATITVAHSKTRDIKKVTEGADIVISGTGVQKFLKGDMIKKGAIVIDIGINKTAEGVAGDIEKESVIGKASWLTPVPGGIGPLTVAMLFKNLLTLEKSRESWRPKV